MRIALIGYGKMGRMIDSLAPEIGASICARINSARDIETAKGADVAIDFSVPRAVVQNVEALASLSVPMVIGTTGWRADLPRVRELVEQHDAACIWGTNFSIGVAILMRLVKEAARLMADRAEYDAWLWEIHHAQKKDAPSGTLISLADAMMQSGYTRPVSRASNRAGHIAGTHVIGFDSVADTIIIEHQTRSREGFARGALEAALWIIGKHGFYEFSEVVLQAPVRTS